MSEEGVILMVDILRVREQTTMCAGAILGVVVSRRAGH